MKEKKPIVRFKGIRYQLRDTIQVGKLPENVIEGSDPTMFLLDRWFPLTREDASATTSLIERNLEWIPTNHTQVCYGLERWGRLAEQYTEWFSLVVVRSVLLPALEAAIICSQSPPAAGASKE